MHLAIKHACLSVGHHHLKISYFDCARTFCVAETLLQQLGVQYKTYIYVDHGWTEFLSVFEYRDIVLHGTHQTDVAQEHGREGTA